MALTLLVANDGGHLQQLHSLSPRLPAGGERRWMTIDSPQTRSLLAGEEVEHLLPSRPRDLVVASRNARLAWSVLRGADVDLVVSTGSSLAVAVLPLAAMLGIPTVYIESATRVSGPSLAGRVMARTPGVRTLTQQRTWAEPGWAYAGSIFDGFCASPAVEPRPVRRMVVTLGTSEHYGFRRLVERLHRVVPPHVSVLWQTGSTDVSGLDLDARVAVPAREMRSAVEEADVVVCHAGTGSSLVALEAGKMPLLVPRRHEHGEHVDSHQVQIARDMAARGLARVADASDVTWDDVLCAAAHRVSRLEEPPPLRW